MIEVLVTGQGLSRCVMDRKDISDSLAGISIESHVGEAPIVILEVAETDAYSFTVKDEQVYLDVAAPVRRLLDTLHAASTNPDAVVEDVPDSVKADQAAITAAYDALRTLFPKEPTE